MINIVQPHPLAFRELEHVVDAPDSYIEKPKKMASGAQMTYRGGKLLKAVELVAVFLGDWGGAKAPTTDLTKFCKALVEGSYLDALSEYNVGHGSFVGSYLVPWTPVVGPPQPAGCLPMLGLLPFFMPKLVALPPPSRFATGGPVGPWSGGPGQSYSPVTIDDQEVRSRLKAAILAGQIPDRLDALYMVYVSPGTVVTLGTDQSCSQFCGYHDSYAGPTHDVYYGVIPFPSCAGCTGPLTVFDAMTSVTSHELAEAVTDAVPGTGWYNDASGEVGDPCAWSNRVLDGYTVQLEWLNSKSGCA